MPGELNELVSHHDHIHPRDVASVALLLFLQ